LELWDYDTGRLIEAIPWAYTNSAQSTACMLYAAQFSKVGGGGGGDGGGGGGGGGDDGTFF